MTIDPTNPIPQNSFTVADFGQEAANGVEAGALAGANAGAVNQPIEIASRRTILPLEQTPENTQLHRSTQPSGLLPRRPSSVSGYELYPIRSIDMQNSVAANNPDTNVRSLGVGQNEVIANGTYYFSSNGQLYPAGPVVRSGSLDYGGPDVGRFRGGVALLSDGTIVVGRSTQSTTAGPQALDDLERRFSPNDDNRLINFMGGGALLIEDGNAVTDQDLRSIQRFRNGAGGLAAPQLGTADRVLVGVRDGQAYLIGARGRSGAQNQQDLLRLGFHTVVAFDGGSASYLRSHESGTTINGRPNNQSPAALGIVVRHW